jgi:hypothetical protein
MLADRFRDRNVFLCGDAAHIWVPFAGYGMNAGIADAMNLSWMLAGVIKGWADPALLEAYEIERRPITDQVSRYAMATSLARTSQQGTIPDALEQPGPEGDAARARVGRQAYEINVGQFCCGGLNFGYFYAHSPIIVYDGEKAPPYTIYDFGQSTVRAQTTPPDANSCITGLPNNKPLHRAAIYCTLLHNKHSTEQRNEQIHKSPLQIRRRQSQAERQRQAEAPSRWRQPLPAREPGQGRHQPKLDHQVPSPRCAERDAHGYWRRAHNNP